MAKAQDGIKLGAKVRGLRRREGLTQAELASRLGISASYLNLIESNRRPLPAALLIKLAQSFGVDLQTFASDDDARLTSELMEVFADPILEGHGLMSNDVREMASASPNAARAILSLYRAYQGARESANSLAQRLEGDDGATEVDRMRLPSEEVGDLIQRHANHFPVLEEGAEALWREEKFASDELYGGLARCLERRHGIEVRIVRWGAEKGTLRRFDPDRKVLLLSELLPTRARKFQLAHQIALLAMRTELDRLSDDPRLTTDTSRALARVALGNYFAGALLMPYGPFLSAAREERYDLDVLGRRFRVGFEQTCHRVTTLRRPGAEGVPFHMLRIDVAGNISKRFSASGIHFARFSGACPRWNVFTSFLTPGLIRIQVSRMPDGTGYFCIARTVHRDSAGYHSPQPVMAIGLGCQMQYARDLVYSDGVDLDNPQAITPVGVTCRLCERTDCEQRALPSLRQPLKIDENVRGMSFYAKSGDER
jgi:predicted transcriptional regulator/transcriptional regulator with XRE-family HTH domain